MQINPPLPRRVAYLVNQYPKVSHSFIRREIRSLEKLGIVVDRYAFRGWDSDVVDPDDEEERLQTLYSLKGGLFDLLGSTLSQFLKSPLAFGRALWAALAMARPSARPWPYHLVYLAHACRLKSWLGTTPVDHLHAHFGTNTAEVAYLLRLLGGPPYSFTVHGPDEIDDSKRLNFDRTVGGAKFVAAISHYTRSQIMRRLPMSLWRKIAVIHCGLPEDMFAADQPPLPEAPTFLCIGRLSEQKGHGILLDAFADVLKSHPKAKLSLAGDGELRAAIEKQIERLGIGASVRITGWISEDQVQSELARARILVQPSLMEGLPVVIMEAFAQFRPVISTYVAGIPELVQHKENGWLVPAGDVASLTEAMRQGLDADTETLVDMAAHGHARTRAMHTVTDETAKLAALMAGEAIAPGTSGSES